MKIIGYTNDSYPEKRSIIEGNLHPLKYIQSVNTERYQRGLQLIPGIGKKVNSTFYEWIPSKPKVDGVHFFNSITRKKVPFITTFESYIPRSTIVNPFDIRAENPIEKVNKKDLYPYLEILASPYCKKLIALSEVNLRMQKELLSYFPEYKESIEEKLVQIHPPQKELTKRRIIEQKEVSSKVKFLFIGRDFVRKGGREIVEVFKRIKEETNFDFELTIVSLGKSKNYAFNEFQDDETDILELISFMKQQDWIKYHESLEPDQVIRLIQDSDVGLLPTWADTYGFSVLEFQASGLPVITTNIRALPELNSNERGWMIYLDVDKFNEIRIKTLEEKQIQREKLKEQLTNIVLDILSNPKEIKQKALAAFDYVSKQHDQKLYMDEISKIYNEVF